VRNGNHSHKCVTCGRTWSHEDAPAGGEGLSLFVSRHTCPYCGSEANMRAVTRNGRAVGLQTAQAGVGGLEVSVPQAQLDTVARGAKTGLGVFAGIMVVGIGLNYLAARAGARRGCR